MGAALDKHLDEVHKKGFTRVEFAGKGIKELPGVIGDKCGTVEELILPKNKLTSLPPEIGALRSLLVLDLAGNALRGVPAEIGRLSRLEKLLLADNNLTDLPPEIAHLQRLKYVHGQPPGWDLNTSRWG